MHTLSQAPVPAPGQMTKFLEFATALSVKSELISFFEHLEWIWKT